MESMDKNKLSAWLNFASKFSEAKQKEQAELPFHMNLIDQLHINENAHSRILMCLLSYKNEEGKYVFLTSLIDLIKKEKQKEDYGSIYVVSPRISQEKERIDLWIMDKDYAIIFENKIYNAADQEAQLSRYIVKTINHGYNEQQIFVVYLSQYPKEPESQSWGEYKDRFCSRYVNLSYCYDILPWLKDNVLCNIKREEPFLQTAFIQYIDYLEGLFKKREIDKTMNMELNKLIELHLGLLGKPETEKVDRLMNEILYVEEVTSQMKALLETSRQEIFEWWREQTRTKYSKFLPCKKYDEHTGWFITDVTVNIDGKEADIYIGEDPFYLYCGFYFNVPLEERQIQNDENKIAERLCLTESNEKKELFVSYSKDKDAYNMVWNKFCEIVDKITNSL